MILTLIATSPLLEHHNAALGEGQRRLRVMAKATAFAAFAAAALVVVVFSAADQTDSLFMKS